MESTKMNNDTIPLEHNMLEQPTVVESTDRREEHHVSIGENPSKTEDNHQPITTAKPEDKKWEDHPEDKSILEKAKDTVSAGVENVKDVISNLAGKVRDMTVGPNEDKDHPSEPSEGKPISPIDHKENVPKKDISGDINPDFKPFEESSISSSKPEPSNIQSQHFEASRSSEKSSEWNSSRAENDWKPNEETNKFSSDHPSSEETWNLSNPQSQKLEEKGKFEKPSEFHSTELKKEDRTENIWKPNQEEPAGKLNQSENWNPPKSEENSNFDKLPDFNSSNIKEEDRSEGAWKPNKEEPSKLSSDISPKEIQNWKSSIPEPQNFDEKGKFEEKSQWDSSHIKKEEISPSKKDWKPDQEESNEFNRREPSPVEPKMFDKEKGGEWNTDEKHSPISNWKPEEHLAERKHV